MPAGSHTMTQFPTHLPTQFPTGIRTAQAIGLTGAAYLAGNIAAYSFASIPALQTAQAVYSAPASLLAKQWRDMYNAGKTQNPPIAALSAAAFAYLAYAIHSGKGAAATHAVLAPKYAVELYAAAAALTAGIVPWTLAVMRGTNKALQGVADEEGKSDDGEVKELLKRWSVLNAIRGALPLLGAVAGFLAL
ncbi:hypothetical protein BDV18DRAFT_49314 [Aspergillus unguis]